MSANEFSPSSSSGRSSDPVQLEGKRAAILLWRGLRRRCPNCGGGPIFRRWVVMRESCPDCHLDLDRGEADYFIGGYTVNFVTAELFVVLSALVVALLTWPDVPWRTIEYGLYLLVVPFPIFTYPFAKSLWLALDLWFRPVTLSDIQGHGENEARVSPEHDSALG